MILKSLSRNTQTFRQLIRYITTPKSPSILHNLPPDLATAEIEHAFLDNAQWATARKNGIWLYHEILAFHPQDSPHLSNPILQDLAQHYLELRAPECLAYAQIHRDTDHPHIHCVISANKLHSTKKHWLKKHQFQHLKQQLQHYQKTHYPHLSASLIPPTRKTAAPRQTSAEAERNRRQQQGKTEPSQKQQVHTLIETCLHAARSEGDFRLRLTAAGLTLYQRGNTPGVIWQGKKYRFKTLGLLEPYQQHQTKWKQTQARQKACRQPPSPQKRQPPWKTYLPAFPNWRKWTRSLLGRFR